MLRDARAGCPNRKWDPRAGCTGNVMCLRDPRAGIGTHSRDPRTVN